MTAFVIAYHINNIFREEELDKDTSVEIFDRSIKPNNRPTRSRLYGDI